MPDYIELMTKCVEDAEKIVRKQFGIPSPLLVGGLAAALFEARAREIALLHAITEIPTG